MTATIKRWEQVADGELVHCADDRFCLRIAGRGWFVGRPLARAHDGRVQVAWVPFGREADGTPWAAWEWERNAPCQRSVLVIGRGFTGNEHPQRYADAASARDAADVEVLSRDGRLLAVLPGGCS